MHFKCPLAVDCSTTARPSPVVFSLPCLQSKTKNIFNYLPQNVHFDAINLIQISHLTDNVAT